MDKLWLSHDEKKKYLNIYSKLHSNDLLGRERILKFIIKRAKINNQQSEVILEKAFEISKEQNSLDQVGFFYLMKYIAYLQNGGNEDVDITSIQSELPLAEITEQKNSSSEKEKRVEGQKKILTNNKRQNSNLLSNSNIIEEAKELQKSDDYQLNDERHIFQKYKLSEEHIESNENPESLFMNGNQNKIPDSNGINPNKVICSSSGNYFKKQNDFYLKNQENSNQQQNEDENENESVVKQKNQDINKQSDFLTELYKNNQRDDQKYSNMNLQNESKTMIKIDQGKKNDGNVGEAQQNFIFANRNSNFKSNQFGQSSEPQFMTFGQVQIEQLTQLSKKHNENNQQVYEKAQYKDEPLKKQNQSQQLGLQLKQNYKEQNEHSFQNKDRSPLKDNQIENRLSHNIKNGLNNILFQKGTIESEEELKDSPCSPKNNKYPILKTENSYYVPAHIDKYKQQIHAAYNDQDELINSVMECKEFSKDQQFQIKNAFDVFKSTREENQLNRSIKKRDKLNKTVRITSYRESDNILKKYVLFTLETEFDGRKYIVERRFNHFNQLNEYFENSSDYYGVIKPKLPSKNMTSVGSYLGSNLMDQQTLEQRKIDLENYLNLYLQNEVLKNDSVLINFLEEKEFSPPQDTQFTLIGMAKKMVVNLSSTDFNELKEYTEAMVKMTLHDFFKIGDEEIDTKDIDSKMETIKKMGNQVEKVINFMNEDIKYDTEQQISVECLEKNYYTEIDQRESQFERQKDPLQDSLKKFKSDALDLCNRIKSSLTEKVKVLQEFRIIHNQIESAKVAQQVLKNKIKERFILKKIKVSRFNKVHEQKYNKSDKTEAKRELDKINERFLQSEDIIKQIQDKLSKELSTFIEIQKQKISDSLDMFVQMNKHSLSNY